MMLQADILTFQEFMVQEKLPLATIHEAVLAFLQNRDDVVVFGAQAVNAYVAEPRMSQDIDLMATQAKMLAELIRHHLSQQFHIAVRVREVAQGRGFRLYQLQKMGNRHLVDIRQVDRLPSAQRIEQVLVMAPADLIASKVMAYHRRQGQPKAGTDWRDVMMLLLQFPELKEYHSPVLDCLREMATDETILALWQDMVRQEITPSDDEAEFF